MSLTAALVQISPTLLDLGDNLLHHVQGLEEARRRGARLAVFPEMSLTGYRIGDASLDASARSALDRDLRASLGSLRKALEALDMDGVVSYPLFEGGRTFIAAEYVERGRTLGVHRKVNLCNYGHYREDQTFTPGEDLTVLRPRWGAAGLLVCEDLWHPVNGILCTQMGAQALLVPSAPSAPSREGIGANLARWRLLAGAQALAQTCYVLCCCGSGPEGAFHGDGGSFAFGPRGDLLLSLREGDPDLGVVDLDLEELARVREETPLLRNERNDLILRTYGRLESGNP